MQHHNCTTVGFIIRTNANMGCDKHLCELKLASVLHGYEFNIGLYSAKYTRANQLQTYRHVSSAFSKPRPTERVGNRLTGA